MQDDIQLFVHVRILKQTVVAQSYIFLLSFTTPFTIYAYFQLFADKTMCSNIFIRDQLCTCIDI